MASNTQIILHPCPFGKSFIFQSPVVHNPARKTGRYFDRLPGPHSNSCHGPPQEPPASVFSQHMPGKYPMSFLVVQICQRFRGRTGQVPDTVSSLPRWNRHPVSDEFSSDKAFRPISDAACRTDADFSGPHVSRSPERM